MLDRSLERMLENMLELMLEQSLEQELPGVLEREAPRGMLGATLETHDA